MERCEAEKQLKSDSNSESSQCQNVVSSCKTGDKILRVVRRKADPLFHRESRHFLRSVSHSLIYSFTALPPERTAAALSCYSHELLKPPDMNYAGAEDGGGTSVFGRVLNHSCPTALL